jgi:hypothetical protein
LGEFSPLGAPQKKRGGLCENPTKEKQFPEKWPKAITIFIFLEKSVFLL